MLCFSIFAGTVAIIMISATAQDYKNCSRKFECGDFRIGYPFSGVKRPRHCGLPSLGLSCSASVFPMIGLLAIPYKILRVDQQSRTLTVLRDGEGSILCFPPRNTTLDTDFFHFAPDTQFVLLYNDCPPPPAGVQLPPSIVQFNCKGPGYYFLPSEDLLGGLKDSVRSWLGSCGYLVRLPVNRTELGSLPVRSAGRLAEVVYRGFGVQWTGKYDGACGNCMNSGGECGSNETSRLLFACYCSDQAYASGCFSLNSPSPPAKPLHEAAEGRNRVLLKILLPIAIFITLSAAAITLFYYIRNRALQNQNGKTSSPLLKPLEFIKMQRAKSAPFGGQGNVESPPSLQAFTLSEIKTATNDFSDDNLLGAGGFGPVYKCVFLGGEEMAVKRLSKSSTQGLLEFTNEVSLTARLQHVNLVRVVGFCTENDEKMLVYEFMPNRSLDIHLFDPVKRLTMDWSTRVRIIEGVTQGLLYLQEYSNYTIIHRDIKASNILLDDEMNPKISDFGMAKLFMKDSYEANTNKIVGTYGYVPPEYVKNGIYSIKHMTHGEEGKAWNSVTPHWTILLRNVS
ncbi:unnamed protein product [Linum tenue]|uniref:non-specific serine/threonine protein kinase n=1 Tax=Linum tenue TaxID=586396 RepID=A0AAV0HUN1_9ROSI|nr:unnamed protein product [Linum tenue]